jgi:hypothetical protein
MGLSIQDGNPWYASPDLWTINQNNGAMNAPEVGDPAQLHANVNWSGPGDWPTDAYVDFYISLPYTGSFDPTLATILYHEHVQIFPGVGVPPSTLPVTSAGFGWVPSVAQGAHQCLIGVTYSPRADPAPIGGGPVDIPTDPHAAQLNLNIVMAAGLRPPHPFHFFFHVTPGIHVPEKDPKEYSLTVRLAREGAIEGLREVLPKRLRHLRFDGEVHQLGITQVLERDDDCDLDDDDGCIEPDIEIPHSPKLLQKRAVVGKLTGGDSAIIHIAQHLGKRPIGGIAVVVLAPE